jgi:sialidase-1
MGLIAHWKLDETAGGTAYDSAGKNHAVVVGNAGWQPEGGKVGGALQLSGVANFAMTGFVLNPANPPFSVFAWVKGGAPGQVVLSQQAGANWLKAATPKGELMTELKGGRAGPLTSSGVITDDAWHRVGFVWDGANRLLYADGVEVARGPQSALPSSTGGLHIGADSKLTAGSFWSGLIDDIRIYNRVVKP